MNNPKYRRIIYIVLLVLFIVDLGYSYKQHLGQPLDGDMAWNLVPNPDVKPILESPLGLTAIANDSTYANPNRFFCHWSFREYLLKSPLVLQNFTTPINSVYHACAIAKILTQFLLILVLATAIIGKFKPFALEFMIAIVLVTPLFQTSGYNQQMAIIDPSTTYAFFYALPALFLAIYFIPFFRKHYHNNLEKNSNWINILWIPLAFVVSLSGPLNTGAALIIGVIVIIPNLLKNFKNSENTNFFSKTVDAIKNIPKSYWFFLFPVCLLSLYSLFLGKYNSITISNQISVWEIYKKIPKGIFKQFFQKMGFPFIFITIIVNVYIIFKNFYNDEGKKLIWLLKWVAIFSAFYILLLPLGGYRPYRPYVLRYDTILPITLGLIVVFGMTSLFVIKNLSVKLLKFYIPFIAIVLAIFTIVDKPNFNRRDCEVSAIKSIVASNKDIVPLEQQCPVLEWKTHDKLLYSTKLNATLLKKWNITKKEKQYFNIKKKNK